jgi:hypothetical protein
MSDPLREDSAMKKWVWAFLLVLLAIGVTVWFARPWAEPTKVETSGPAPQSTEWAPEPEGSAVPITLPKTPMTNVPDEDKGAASETKKDAD